MDYRIVWVHGIGQNRPGYSTLWEKAFNQYFHFPHRNYLEVCWDTVFDPVRTMQRSLGSQEVTIALTPQEQLAEAEVRQELQAILLARATVMAQPSIPARGGDQKIVQWSELIDSAGGGKRELLSMWLTRLDSSLGDFVKYLVSRRLRNAIKEKVKDQLRPLVNSEYSISLIAHSWGSVVSYESLLDMEVELPSLRIANLITLGSPLWLVHHLLEDRSGRKPGNLANWVNIHARGDLVGSWLSSSFQVDKEFEVPNFGNGDPHGSYFVVGNEAVQHDIIAQAVLRED